MYCTPALSLLNIVLYCTYTVVSRISKKFLDSMFQQPCLEFTDAHYELISPLKRSLVPLLILLDLDPTSTVYLSLLT